MSSRAGGRASDFRAAYRRKLRTLHPAVSSDHSLAGQTVARDVLDAYRVLCRHGEQGNLVLGPCPAASEEPARRRAQSGIDAGRDAWPLQFIVAAALILTVVVLTPFFLIAFAPSGR